MYLPNWKEEVKDLWAENVFKYWRGGGVSP
jgi:hypothetical protein